MMAECRAESTREINNYGRYINQFPPNIIKSIRRYERINKKICRQKFSIMFNEIHIYSHPETDLFRSIRTHQCALTVSSRSWDRNPVDSNAKQKLLTIQPPGDISCEVNFKRLGITITIVYIHPFNGSRDLNSSTKRLAIDANGYTITSSPVNSTLWLPSRLGQ